MEAASSEQNKDIVFRGGGVSFRTGVGGQMAVWHTETQKIDRGGGIRTMDQYPRFGLSLAPGADVKGTSFPYNIIRRLVVEGLTVWENPGTSDAQPKTPSLDIDAETAEIHFRDVPGMQSEVRHRVALLKVIGLENEVSVSLR